MSFFNKVSDWFSNNIIKATYDPGADALKSLYRQNVTQNILGLQNTVSSLGGGLGAAIVSIPGVGQPILDGLNALKKESEDLLASMEQELLRRKFGPPVRLEVDSTIDIDWLDTLTDEIGISSDEIVKYINEPRRGAPRLRVN